tara:strand:+ start:14634 stop:15665 length:1032 start_codon:yes stop_codon:yes gene_type:complete
VKESIRQKAVDLGFDACRFTSAQRPDHSSEFENWLKEERHGELGWLERNAHKRTNPQQVVPGAKSIICLASVYSGDKERTDTEPSAGTIARYARFDDYHEVLKQPLRELNSFVNELQGEEPRSKKSLWYVDTGPILERDFAQRSGLGFIGKHTNLISRNLGNWIFLSEIITTLQLEPDAPEKNHCGNCTDCIDACPTDAITAPFQLDARRCISYLTIELKGSIPEEFRPAIGNRIYGCDDCLEVCPWNRFAKDASLMNPFRREDLKTPDLVELLSLSEEEFRQRFRGTPMFRTKRRGVLRNVCIALGNSGNQDTLPVLEKARQDPEPLIAEHADWAIRNIEKG